MNSCISVLQIIKFVGNKTVGWGMFWLSVKGLDSNVSSVTYWWDYKHWVWVLVLATWSGHLNTLSFLSQLCKQIHDSTYTVGLHICDQHLLRKCLDGKMTLNIKSFESSDFNDTIWSILLLYSCWSFGLQCGLGYSVFDVLIFLQIVWVFFVWLIFGKYFCKLWRIM
jgi:hypothetical protein